MKIQFKISFDVELEKIAMEFGIDPMNDQDWEEKALKQAEELIESGEMQSTILHDLVRMDHHETPVFVEDFVLKHSHE